MINVRVFDGSAYKVEKHNVRRDDMVAFPKDAVLIASDIVMDGDESVAEIWLAVPFVQSSPVAVPVSEAPIRKVEIPPGVEAWPIEEEEDYGITVDVMEDDADE